MPTYDWKCNKCQGTSETVRDMKESSVPPDQGEPLTRVDKNLTENCKHDWEKYYPKAPAMERGANWGGSKGNW